MDYYQLIKYFENKCNPTEIEEIEKWLQNSEEHKKTFQDIQKIWANAKTAPDLIQVDYKKAWKTIESKTGIKDYQENIVPQKSLLRQFLKMAAILIVLLGVGAIIKTMFINKPELISELNLTASQKEIHLSDGTIVILNRNSKLTYPAKFIENTREIELEGEAFFNVAKDSLHPFIVHAGGTITRVLGTSFNIDSKNVSRVIVSVVEGKVAFNPESTANNQVQLTKGERGIFEKEAQKLSKIQITDENYLSWQTGILAFNNQTLREAVKVLSEYYSKTIEVQPELQNRKITVTFNNQPLSEVLEILEMTLHIKIDSNQEITVLKTLNSN
jgi:ferric-dicitrate binding protein FerR (iron transport regulator)